MRDYLIRYFERRSRSARNTAEHEQVFVDAKVALSLTEYAALLNRLWQPAEAEIETSRPSLQPAGLVLA